jgi:hypothetical protein
MRFNMLAVTVVCRGSSSSSNYLLPPFAEDLQTHVKTKQVTARHGSTYNMY